MSTPNVPGNGLPFRLRDFGISFRRSSRSRTEIRGGQKKVMRLWIDAHRASAKLGLECLYFRELVWCILMKNVDLAIAGGHKQQRCCRLGDTAVHTSADGQRLDDLAIIPSSS